MNPDALRTVKVDPETMETLARRSLLDGPPASVAFDPDDKVSSRAALAGLVCLVVAFATGALLRVLVVRSEFPPPLPAPVRARVEPVTLKPLELEAPRSEPSRLLHKPRMKQKIELVDPWKKPLFNQSAYERP